MDKLSIVFHANAGITKAPESADVPGSESNAGSEVPGTPASSSVPRGATGNAPTPKPGPMFVSPDSVPGGSYGSDAEAPYPSPAPAPMAVSDANAPQEDSPDGAYGIAASGDRDFAMLPSVALTSTASAPEGGSQRPCHAVYSLYSTLLRLVFDVAALHSVSCTSLLQIDGPQW